MKTPLLNIGELLDSILEVLEKDDRVVFAYLYGSMVTEGDGNDIDIAVFSVAEASTHELSADLKVGLHLATGVVADRFDVRILNPLIENGDLLALLYLRNVLDGGQVLVDKDPSLRGDVLERYGTRFRECEGLMQEVLA